MLKTQNKIYNYIVVEQFFITLLFIAILLRKITPISYRSHQLFKNKPSLSLN